MNDKLQTLEPQSITEATDLCKSLVASGFLPSSIKTPQQALTILLYGREHGMSAMQSFNSIHVIKGKPSLSADAMVGVALASGNCTYFSCIESTDQRATYETLRRGAPAPVRRSYTIAEAKQAGLTSNPVWSQHRAAMLRARAKSSLARDVYPDRLAGVYEPGEVAEFEAPTLELVQPHVDDAQTVTAEPSLFEVLCQKIEETKTNEQLLMVAKDFSTDDFDADQVEHLRHLYRAKSAQFSSRGNEGLRSRLGDG